MPLCFNKVDKINEFHCINVHLICESNYVQANVCSRCHKTGRKFGKHATATNCCQNECIRLGRVFNDKVPNPIEIFTLVKEKDAHDQTFNLKNI